MDRLICNIVIGVTQKINNKFFFNKTSIKYKDYLKICKNICKIIKYFSKYKI